MNLNFEIEGITPLLMHHDDVEAADTLKAWQQDPRHKDISVPGDDRSPPWTWQTYLYSDGEHVTIPAENLMVALRTAGAQVKLKGPKTYKSLTQSGLLIPSEHLKLNVGNPGLVAMKDILAIKDKTFAEQAQAVKPLGFKLFVKRAKVGQNKHVRVRPRFDMWSISGKIQVLKPEINLQKLRLIFEIAGTVGLCDWRPSAPKSPGPFGMFTSKVTK